MGWKYLTGNQRKRGFVFTLNNYTADDIDEIVEVCNQGNFYVIYGREVAPTTGTPHLQGFIYMPNAKTQSAVDKLFMIQVRDGNLVQKNRPWHCDWAKDNAAAIAYCKKEGNWDDWNSELAPMSQEEKGKKGGEKMRELYKSTVELAKQGRMEECDPKLYLIYYNTLSKLNDKALANAVYEEYTVFDFHWFYGPSGTGKSSTASKMFPNAFRKNTSKWWDGYDRQEVVIIEEVSPRPVSDMSALAQLYKVLCDNPPLMVECKGSSMKIRPKCVIFTSNYSIEELWVTSQERDPLLRRIKQWHFTHVANGIEDVRPPNMAIHYTGSGGPPEVLKFTRPTPPRVVEVSFNDHSKEVELVEERLPEPMAAPLADLESEPVAEPRVSSPIRRMQEDKGKGRHTFGTFRHRDGETKLDEEEFDSQDTEFEEHPKVRARRERRKQASKASKETKRARFSQASTQLVTQDEMDETFTGPVPLRRTQRVAEEVEDVSDAAAALLELNDGDSEPEDGQSLGSEDTVPMVQRENRYADTDSEIDSEEELGISDDGPSRGSEDSDEESLF